MNVDLTPAEHDTLAWLSDRYGSADVLYAATDDLAPDVDGPPVYVLTIGPETLRDYWRALLEDNGDPAQDVPPCAGGAEMRAAREALGDPDPWEECEGWFSHSACDVCGSGRWEDPEPFANGRLGGTRYHAVTFPS